MTVMPISLPSPAPLVRVARLLKYAVVLLALAGVTPSGRGQPLVPHIGYVYPAGGRQGATFQVQVGGQYLAAVSNAYVCGDGVRAAVVEYNRPLNQKEFNDLRDEFRKLQEKRRTATQAARRGGAQTGPPASTNVWTAADQSRIAEIRNRILKNPPNRQGNPAIAESITLQLTIAPEAEAGERELRLVTPAGVSNPLMFCVGQLPEFSKPAARILPDVNLVRQLTGSNPPAATGAASEMRVTLPAVINGQIMPGAVDQFRFAARRGQRLVAAVSARELIPYLADAVPGWFQATLTLYDAKGRELAYDDDFRFNPDPVLYYQIPADGEYVLEIKDAIYRGRQDFVYRITIGELPFVTGIFPLGGPAGKQTRVELLGWNLPTNSVTEDVGDKDPGIHPVYVRKEGRFSNHVPFDVDSLPECVAEEPNSSAAKPQPVTLPIIINGRINQPGECDVFRFAGHAGEEIVAEVSARRLGSPLDSALTLTDSTDRQLAFNDDFDDKGDGLTTHHADSFIRTVLPADGTYFLHLRDVQHQGGPEYGYRLRISPPRPDFQLRLVPSGFALRGGVSTPVTVYALRKDGFTNEIQLALRDAPPGVSLGGARVPAGQDKIRLTLAASPESRKEPLRLALEGHATVNGRELVRPVVPADDQMQAFAYWHLVPAKELMVLVSDRAAMRVPLRIAGELPVLLPLGATQYVRIAAPPAFAERFELELSEPPEGITLQRVTSSRNAIEIALRTDSTRVAVGLEGNLIVNVFPARPPDTPGKPRPPANRQRTPIGTLPAIPFKVVSP